MTCASKTELMTNSLDTMSKFLGHEKDVQTRMTSPLLVPDFFP